MLTFLFFGSHTRSRTLTLHLSANEVCVGGLNGSVEPAEFAYLQLNFVFSTLPHIVSIDVRCFLILMNICA